MCIIENVVIFSHHHKFEVLHFDMEYDQRRPLNICMCCGLIGIPAYLRHTEWANGLTTISTAIMCFMCIRVSFSVEKNKKCSKVKNHTILSFFSFCL